MPSKTGNLPAKQAISGQRALRQLLPGKPEIKFLALSFAFPVLVMGAAFAMHGVFPFGDRQIMVVDFWQQYYPFFSDYWHKLREGSSLLWSWSLGAGINYLALAAYYLASPLNLLIALFPHSLLREAVTLILLLKIGFAGLFFALYLRYAYRRCDISLPLFSMFFALCAYTLGYYWNIMWFDTFALLPLVMLGLHALVREGRRYLYVISLALAVIINYYVGLFICIFTVFMFVILCVTEGLSLRQFLRRLIQVAACTAPALGLTAVLTIPTFMSLQKTYSALNSFPSAFRQYESYFDILGNFIAFTPPTTLEGLPNLYCGMLTILLLGPFLRSGRIPLKIKLMYTALAAFIIVSCNINFLNFIWHGFHFTNMLPYRFSFLASFIMIVIAYHRFASFDDMDLWDIPAMAASGAVFLGCAALGRQEWKHIAASAGIGAAYIAIFALLIYFGRQDAVALKTAARGSAKKKKKPAAARTARLQVILSVILLLIALAEISLTAYNGVTAVRTTQRSIYPDKYDDIQAVLAMREQPAAGSGFFRTDTVNWYTTNDPALYGYDGISIFSSTINRSTTSYMLGLGIYAGLAGNRYIHTQTTPVASAFLNLKYLVSRSSDIPDRDVYWQEAGSSGDAVLLENKYCLPFAFMAGSALAGYSSVENDPFASQNDLFRRATGLQGDLFEKMDIVHVDYRGYDVSRHELGNYSIKLQEGVTEGSLKWNYEMPASGPLYVYVKIDRPESVRIMQNEKTVRNRRSPYPVLFCAGVFEKGDLISVYAENERASGRAVIYAATIDHDLFERGYEILSANTMELTRFSATRIEGSVSVENAGLLYTSIPYEKGWKAYVDGIESGIITVGGSMAAVHLDAGTHDVEFRYINDGLVPGVVISLLSAAAFAGTVLWKRMRCQ